MKVTKKQPGPLVMPVQPWPRGDSLIGWINPKAAKVEMRELAEAKALGWPVYSQWPSWLKATSRSACGLTYSEYGTLTQRQREAAELYYLTEIHRRKRRQTFPSQRDAYRGAIRVFEALRKRNAYYDELVERWGDLPVQDLDRYADLVKQYGNLGRSELEERAKQADNIKPLPVAAG